ncbi:MAG: hypothetical protein P4L99_16955 [Chthoniobacter sp.]|nr:hypothetical protein [Chthoniobacter sp.]
MSEHDGRKPPAAWLSQLRAAGHWDRLIEMAGRSLAVDPNDPETHRQIAWAYAASDRPAKMQPHVDFLLQAEPGHASSHHLAAVYHLDLQRHTQARPHIETLLRMDANSATYHYLACLLALRDNKVKVARVHIEQARKLAPDWVAAAHLEIRMDAIHQHKAQESWARIRRLEATLALEPQNAAIHTTIGEIYLGELERPREAERFFRQALLIDPMNKARQNRLLDAVRARSLLYRTLSMPMRAMRHVLGSLRQGRVQLIVMVVAVKAFLVFAVWVVLVGVFFTPAAFVYEWLVMADVMRTRPLPRWLGPLAAPLGWPHWIRMSICLGIIVGAWLLFFTKVCHLPAVDSLEIISGIFGFHFVIVALVVGLRRLRGRIGQRQDQRRQLREARPAMESGLA